METLAFIILGCLLAYLFGSIPSAVWVGQAFFGIDIRDYGSGNAGATNTFRVLGKKWGVLVMLMDLVKGYTAATLPWIMVSMNVIPYDDVILYQLLCGMFSVVGHVFPVFSQFRGGKGIATLFGMVLAIHPIVALLCLLIFLVVLLTSRFVSLGSMIGTLCFPILLLLPRFNPEEPALIVFGFLMFGVVIFTHQKNIRRLLKGQESKANIRIRRRNP